MRLGDFIIKPFLLMVLLLVWVGTAQGGGKTKKNKSKNPEESVRTKLREMYEKIAAVKLEPWEHEESVVITEKDAKGYKIVRPDDTVEFSDQIPETGEKIKKLYVRRNPSGFTFVMTDKGRQFVWNRLYWHPDQKKWLPTDARYSLFVREKAKVRDFLFTLNSHFDKDVAYRLPILVSQLRNPRLKEDIREKYTKELRELTGKIGDSWGGAKYLDAVYDINIEIPGAAIEDQVKLANKRRKLLKQIAKKVKP